MNYEFSAALEKMHETKDVDEIKNNVLQPVLKQKPKEHVPDEETNKNKKVVFQDKHVVLNKAQLKQSDSSNKPETGEHENVKEKKERNRLPTKVVVRRLPPSMNLDVFVDYVSPLPEHDYIYFVAADTSLGPHAFSRVYINFVNFSDLITFHEQFDNYVFMDNKGNEYPAVVEFAPFQKIPKKRPGRKKDPKAGTLREDPDYIAFLETLKENQEATSQQTSIDLLIPPDRSPQKVITTPLLEYIKQRKAEQQRLRDERREERRRKEIERKRIKDEERRKRKEADAGTKISRNISEEKEDVPKVTNKEKDFVSTQKKKDEERERIKLREKERREKQIQENRQRDSKIRDTSIKSYREDRQKVSDSRNQKKPVLDQKRMGKSELHESAENDHVPDKHSSVKRKDDTEKLSDKPYNSHKDSDGRKYYHRDSDSKRYDRRQLYREDFKKSKISEGNQVSDNKQSENSETVTEKDGEDGVGEESQSKKWEAQGAKPKRRYGVDSDHKSDNHKKNTQNKKDISEERVVIIKRRNSSECSELLKGDNGDENTSGSLSENQKMDSSENANEGAVDTVTCSDEKQMMSEEQLPINDISVIVKRSLPISKSQEFENCNSESKTQVIRRRSSLESGDTSGIVAKFPMDKDVPRAKSVDVVDTSITEQITDFHSKQRPENPNDQPAHKESPNSCEEKRDPRTERRIRNKDRPSIEIYRPGMGRFSMQRKEREKNTSLSSSVDQESPSTSPAPRSSKPIKSSQELRSMTFKRSVSREK